MTRPPLNGAKTHPLSDHARSQLKTLRSGPRPAQDFNAGVTNRFLREDLVTVVRLPSPFKTHKGRLIDHLQITPAGRAATEARDI